MFDACLGDADVGVRVAALKAACSFFQDVYTADAGGRCGVDRDGFGWGVGGGGKGEEVAVGVVGGVRLVVVWGKVGRGRSLLVVALMVCLRSCRFAGCAFGGGSGGSVVFGGGGVGDVGGAGMSVGGGVGMDAVGGDAVGCVGVGASGGGDVGIGVGVCCSVVAIVVVVAVVSPCQHSSAASPRPDSLIIHKSPPP